MSLRHIFRPAVFSPRSFTYRATTTRTYASQTPGSPVLEIFNRKVKHLQKDRAAQNVDESRKTDYIKDEVAIRLCERLLDIKRDIPNVLDLGANSCNIARALTMPDLDPINPNSPPLATRISNLTCVDTSHALLHRDADEPFNKEIVITREVIPDLETLPYAPNTFDAVLSSLSIHWINDLPSLLAQVNSILKPDCPFIAAMFGGDTLFELRTSLQLADSERRGGVSPHVSPLADVRDVGGLLNKAGFKMLTVDVEDIVVEYPDTFALMQDLQAMGENNAILHRELGPMSRDVLLANEAIYRQLHKDEESRGIPATFRLIYMIGWKEGKDQAQPLARGSGEINLKDILGGGDFSNQK
ncbi:S-adenosyl-L-methionine-dependent methyltransferase [Aspergillus alliaceus]|uniref:S-adenosyl-L-methionine-dependent methyltransferase n=1 Tax=Petromyces alliaceus TaxID=209559 RepID=A0A5N6FIX4_PETAA|nr:S-adenosyl-L-methionine-dependent methyltransferase [Aspergillus alliaceus]KAB8228584.1 S-adenosyl-L-methionine-dependent methyltransferase [Aspergillus alliaceus]KAE8390499.1 S-adenosyl-L-methionine-dependent methyltransferase [Aspergillus alliaceus]